jgi:hypothetical protein
MMEGHDSSVGVHQRLSARRVRCSCDYTVIYFVTGWRGDVRSCILRLHTLNGQPRPPFRKPVFSCALQQRTQLRTSVCDFVWTLA